jgi:glycosyltransferase involved in cell wall biosynthesis
MDKKVSVVLPVRYVNFEWLESSIRSIQNQDYANIELIVVNDEATDDIDDLIKSFGIKKYIKNGTNKKLPYSLNRGFEIAEGEYHTWTSADNFMMPTMISRLVEELEKRKDYSIVCGRCIVLDANNSYNDLKSGEEKLCELLCCDLYDTNIERRYTYFSTLGPCFLYKKEVWETLRGYDENCYGSEDFDFWIRASEKYKICRLPYAEEPLYIYRTHSNSISSTVRGCFTSSRLVILNREFSRFPEDEYLRKSIKYYKKRTDLQNITSRLNRAYLKKIINRIYNGIGNESD